MHSPELTEEEIKPFVCSIWQQESPLLCPARGSLAINLYLGKILSRSWLCAESDLNLHWMQEGMGVLGALLGIGGGGQDQCWGCCCMRSLRHTDWSLQPESGSNPLPPSHRIARKRSQCHQFRLTEMGCLKKFGLVNSAVFKISVTEVPKP